MNKEYSDDIRLNDGDFSELLKMLGIEVPEKNVYTDELKAACDAITEGIKNLNRLMTEAVERSPLVIRVRKEDIKNDDVLRQIDEQETATLKEACAIVERHNSCFNSSTEFCYTKACKECEYYQDPDVVYNAVKRLLDHAKKSLDGGEKIENRYIRNVTGGVELYDDAGQFVGYVYGFTDSGVTGSKETEAIIRSIVQSSWGLLTFNPFTLERIIEDHGYIADLNFIVEMYKDCDDIKLPKDWCVIKRKVKEVK